jgi:hypothetical protein
MVAQTYNPNCFLLASLAKNKKQKTHETPSQWEKLDMVGCYLSSQLKAVGSVK